MDLNSQQQAQFNNLWVYKAFLIPLADQIHPYSQYKQFPRIPGRFPESLFFDHQRVMNAIPALDNQSLVRDQLNNLWFYKAILIPLEDQIYPYIQYYYKPCSFNANSVKIIF